MEDSDVDFTLKGNNVIGTLKCKRSILENVFVKNDESYADLDQTRKNITIAKNTMNSNVEVKYDTTCDELSVICCLLYTSPSPRDKRQSRMPSSA